MIFWNNDMWNEMERLRREMDGIMSGVRRSAAASSFPLVNIYEDAESVRLCAELPGVDREKVAITFNEGVLTISGKSEIPEALRNMTAIRQERSSGDFSKSVRIPIRVDQEKISAGFADGVLTVTLPKAEEAKPKTIRIEAK